MILHHIAPISENETPLQLIEMERPAPGKNEILICISSCGVCHTEVDEIEGRTPPPRLPIVLGHQVVGRVEETGQHSNHFSVGDRVGVAWIYSSCGTCEFCKEENDNLCSRFKATGRDVNGGYAEYMTVSEDFAYHIPDVFSDVEAAPLLCAGAIGYRSLKLSGLHNGDNLGLTGFGASAHLVLMMTKHRYPQSKVFVFARSEQERLFAKELGADWTGDMEDEAPEKLHSIIDTTPVWKPIVEGMKNLRPRGRLIINAIRKEEIDKASLLQLDYPTHLWMEKEIKSVANVSRADVKEFLELAAQIPIKPEIQEFALEDANHALVELKERKIRGAKVLRIR